MKTCQVLLMAAVLIAAVVAYPNIVKRQAGAFSYELPAGAELIVGNIRSTFECGGRKYGYYADVENECHIFHICLPIQHPNGAQENKLYSFLCPNQTFFDQSQLICEFETHAPLQCAATSDWLYLNEFFNLEDKEFYPRKGIPDHQPQGSVASAPAFPRGGLENRHGK